MLNRTKKPHDPDSLEKRLGFHREGQKRRPPSEDPEIVDDYLAVCLLLERLRNARTRDGKLSQAVQNHLETARVCLEQVGYAPTLEEKWSCINQANAVLVLACVNRDEQAAVMLRLKNLFPLLRGFKDRLPDPFKDFGPTDDDVKNFDPQWAYEVLETAAQGWHLVNEQNSFSTRFWEKAWRYVMVLLIAGIVATELAVSVADVTESPTWRQLLGMFALPATWAGIIELKYVWAAVFGALGGALSSLLGSRSLFVSATTYRVSRSQARMRILLGAVGAFIVVLAIDSELLFSENFVSVIESFTGLAVVAIAAGFSERLFIAALERIGGTLEKSKPGEGAAATAAPAVAGAAAAVAADPDAVLRALDIEDQARQVDLADAKAQEAAVDDGIEALLRDEDAEDLLHQVDEDDRAKQT